MVFINLMLKHLTTLTLRNSFERGPSGEFLHFPVWWLISSTWSRAFILSTSAFRGCGLQCSRRRLLLKYHMRWVGSRRYDWGQGFLGRKVRDDVVPYGWLFMARIEDILQERCDDGFLRCDAPFWWTSLLLCQKPHDTSLSHRLLPPTMTYGKLFTGIVYHIKIHWLQRTASLSPICSCSRGKESILPHYRALW